jgi:hypothetical protein
MNDSQYIASNLETNKTGDAIDKLIALLWKYISDEVVVDLVGGPFAVHFKASTKASLLKDLVKFLA